MQKGEQRVTMHVVEETSTNDHISVVTEQKWESHRLYIRSVK